MSDKKYEIVKFVDNGFELEVNVSPDEETVWLSKLDIAMLFERDRSVVSRHIKNIFEENECQKGSNVHFMHIGGRMEERAFLYLKIMLLLMRPVIW